MTHQLSLAQAQAVLQQEIECLRTRLPILAALHATVAECSHWKQLDARFVKKLAERLPDHTVWYRAHGTFHNEREVNIRPTRRDLNRQDPTLQLRIDPAVFSGPIPGLSLHKMLGWQHVREQIQQLDPSSSIAQYEAELALLPQLFALQDALLAIQKDAICLSPTHRQHGWSDSVRTLFPVLFPGR